MRTSPLSPAFFPYTTLFRSEAPLEAAVGALDVMILPVLLFLLGLAFTRDGQHAVLDGDFYVVFFHFGQFGLDEVFLVVDRKSTRLNSSHRTISYAVFCLKKK